MRDMPKNCDGIKCFDLVGLSGLFFISDATPCAIKCYAGVHELIVVTMKYKIYAV